MNVIFAWDEVQAEKKLTSPLREIHMSEQSSDLKANWLSKDFRMLCILWSRTLSKVKLDELASYFFSKDHTEGFLFLLRIKIALWIVKVDDSWSNHYIRSDWSHHNKLSQTSILLLLKLTISLDNRMKTSIIISWLHCLL